MQREKHVVLQEIGAANDHPDDLVFDLFQDAAYGGQPLVDQFLAPRKQ